MASFLTPAQLATRWNVAITTLSQWRWNGCGPEFHKIGRCVSYAIEDIEEFEASKRRRSTSEHCTNRSKFSDGLGNAEKGRPKDDLLLNSKLKKNERGS